MHNRIKENRLQIAMKRNRLEWKPGDVVIHYSAPKNHQNLMVVIGYNIELKCVVECLATKKQESDTVDTFLDPLTFGMKVKNVVVDRINIEE